MQKKMEDIERKLQKLLYECYKQRPRLDSILLEDFLAGCSNLEEMNIQGYKQFLADRKEEDEECTVCS